MDKYMMITASGMRVVNGAGTRAMLTNTAKARGELCVFVPTLTPSTARTIFA